MSFLYRTAVTLTRRQPYIDWANSLEEEGPALTDELNRDQRTVYLVREPEGAPDVEEILAEHWQDMFDNELAAWILDRESWPSPRTRAMFDQWFDVEVTDAVCDLIPDEPLTQADVDAAD